MPKESEMEKTGVREAGTSVGDKPARGNSLRRELDLLLLPLFIHLLLGLPINYAKRKAGGLQLSWIQCRQRRENYEQLGKEIVKGAKRPLSNQTSNLSQ
jgi:hypothetical protein